jgi:hypothetical protein
MYWPNMDKSIDELVSKRPTCLRHRRSKPKENLLKHQIPERPWQRLVADIMTFKQRDFLLIADYYHSKYVELPLLQDKTASSVITSLKSIFARHDILDKLVCDNMPFASHQPTTSAKNWGFKIVTTSSRYPQSNGLAERHIQAAPTQERRIGPVPRPAQH